MKAFFSLALLGLLVAGCASNKIIIRDKSDWAQSNNSTITSIRNQPIQLISGNEIIYSSDTIAIDPNKIYRLEGEFRVIKQTDPQSDYIVYLGIANKDQQGKIISNDKILCVPDSFTLLTKDCSANDTELYIQNGMNWKKNDRFRIAFAAKDNFSDLPNANLAKPCLIDNAVELSPNEWKVTLSEPIGFTAKAGEGVRLHRRMGGFPYVAGNSVIANATWVKLSGVISGKAIDFTKISKHRFSPGVVNTSIVLFRQCGKDDVLAVRNVSFLELKPEEVTEAEKQSLLDE